VACNEVPGAQPPTNQARSDTYVDAYTSIFEAHLADTLPQDEGVPGSAPQGAPSGTSNSGPRDGGSQTVVHSHSCVRLLWFTPPLTDANMHHNLLSSLLIHAHTSEETNIQMASQIDELNRALATLVGHVSSSANRPTQAQPPPVTLNPPPCHPRRPGPGQPREPAPCPTHRPLELNQFYVDAISLISQLIY
jgi:hypothetical protein